MFDLKLLDQLRQKLSQEKKLASIWSFYMDNFTDYAEFTDLGQPTSNPLLEAIVAQICQQLYGQKSKVKDLLLIRIPEYQFVHGPFSVGGRMGALIYFEKAQMGLVAISDLPPSSDVKYSRFSTQALKKPDRSWLN